jgi:thimet oligopeptidase
MTQLKRELTKDPQAQLEYYDIAYYGEQLRHKKFNIESEKIREYFPLQIVKEGMMEIYSKLLGASFKKIDGYPTWHPDTEFYEVTDAKDKKTIAYFILDLYPRENKYGHAAVQSWTEGWLDGDTYNTPVAVMMANFPKPSAEHPSLMSHDEVNTFFHEFGHIMHHLLTTAKYASYAGTSVARDFVEAPSQMLENWVWDEEMLGILSGHYKDSKKKLPKEHLDNLLKAKQHLIAYDSTRQFCIALFDLQLHTKKIKDVSGLFDKLMYEYTGIKRPKKNIWPAGFGHICGGYDAGYYGYMWSKVYSCDMFTRFQKEGLLNTKTGTDYRNWILEPGSSMEEGDLVKGFLGRKPNNKAFLKEIGL